jgi:hypothetical protein
LFGTTNISVGSATTQQLSYSNSLSGAEGSTFSATLNGIASYTELGAYANGTLDDPLAASKGNANTYAYLVDTFTVFAPGSATQSGYLYITATLDGSRSQSGSAAASVLVDVYDSLSDTTMAVGNGIINPLTDTVRFPVPFDITFGSPFSLILELNASAIAGYDTTGMGGTFGGDGTATANYFDTLTISGLQVFDSNMDPISDPTFVTGSGTQYTVNGVVQPSTVPEPSTVPFLAVGILCLLLRRRYSALASSTK